MVTVTLVGGAPRGLELEMIATTKPRLMFPSTSIKIDGLDPESEYRVYLKLVRSPYRYKLNHHTWEQEQVYHPKETNEEKMVLNKHRQQTGAFFMQHGISFENARISFNKKETKQCTNTIYVRKYFRYTQHVYIDQMTPGEGNRSCKVYSLVGGEFVVVSQFESSRMSQYYAIGFENIRQFGKKRPRTLKSTQRIHPLIIMDHPSEIPSSNVSFQVEDPDDVPPIPLPDGSVVTRKYGRTYWYPPAAKGTATTRKIFANSQ